MADFIDGTSKTLLMVECLCPLTIDNGWRGPIGDITIGHYPGVTTFRTPNTSVPDEGWGSDCYPASAANGLPPCVQAPTYGSQMTAARSAHPGGVMAARCDGSVSFVPDDIDVEVWRQFGTTKGGETASLPF